MSLDVSGAINDVKARVQRLRENHAVYLAAKGTMVTVAKRVWDVGGLTDGGTIAYKEDYDLYAYTPPAPRKVTGKGKPFKDWKSTKNAPKTKGGAVQSGARKIKGGYYTSYLNFKKQQGRADNPFELTGRLRKAYLSSNDAPDSLVELSPTEVAIKLRGEEAQKYVGLTEEKGTFLGLTEFERKEYRERLFEIYRSE